MSKQMKIWVGLGSFFATLTVLGLFVSAPYLYALVSQGNNGATCPFGGSRNNSPLLRDQTRDAQAALLRGPGRAAHTRLMGLALKASKRDDIEAWAQARAMTCRAQKSGRGLDCASATPGAVDITLNGARAMSILFELDRHKNLKSMKVMADFPTAGSAAHYLHTKFEETKLQVGAPGETSGEASEAYLGSRIFRQARAQFHSQDLFARLSATHLSLGHFMTIHALQDLTAS